MKQSELNPLFSPQREIKGAETFEDYAYQYHWALYRAIQEHNLQKEYAIFVELHEDVVVSNSLNSKIAQFEFNQVKTTKKKFTEISLCTLTNGKSVLGKLISSATNKPFTSQINHINLVAVHGFKLNLKLQDIKLQTITLSDLHHSSVKKLANKIKAEIGLANLPVNLQFVVPDLIDGKFQNDVIAEIAKLIVALFPGANYNAVYIYQVLIDELNRKGTVTYDYKEWDDLLKNKALTSERVQKVINEFTNLKDEAKIESLFDQIANELGYIQVIARRELKKNFDRYRQSRVGNRSTTQIRLSNTICKSIKAKIQSVSGDMNVLILKVTGGLDQKTKNYFSNENHLRAAIICEYIMEEL